MKFCLFSLLFLISNLVCGQCFDILSTKLDNLEVIPYSLVDKRVYDVESGKTYTVKISDVQFKTKLAFLIQTHGIADSIDVTLITLNWKVLSRKIVKNGDCILRCDPFKKSENYFLLIKIPPTKEVQKGCLGLLILKRETKRAFKKVQKIEWKFEEVLERPN